MKILSEGARLGSRLLLSVLLIVVPGCRETLMHNLGEIEANTIIMHLDSQGIKAQKEPQADGEWSIVVPQADSVRAMQVLSNRRMLRKAPPAFKRSSSMLASREEQKMRFERSLSAEIEYTLTTMPGVLDARVHLNLPERDPLLGEMLATQAGMSGSVLLLLAESVAIDEGNVERLVSGASGIPVENIAVLRAKVAQAASELSGPEMRILQESQTEELVFPAKYQALCSAVISCGALAYGFFVIKRYRMRRKISAVADVLHSTGTIVEGA